jgi:hypothetical protein
MMRPQTDTAADTPTTADDPVSVNSCVGTAMTLNEPPTAEIADATQSRRKAGIVDRGAYPWGKVQPAAGASDLAVVHRLVSVEPIRSSVAHVGIRVSMVNPCRFAEMSEQLLLGT